MVDVVPSDDEVNAARNGIYMQLKETTSLVKEHGSLAQAIHNLGLDGFIENQVQALASSRAWVRVTENRLNNNIHDCGEINAVVDSVIKTFGTHPASTDNEMMVSSCDYNVMAEAINKLSNKCRR